MFGYRKRRKEILVLIVIAEAIAIFMANSWMIMIYY